MRIESKFGVLPLSEACPVGSDGTGRTAWGPEFLERFRLGDADALRKVYVEHAPEIARAVRRFLGSRGQVADVEDVVQEVFSRAFTKNARNAFDGSLRYGPYVATVARNVLIDWVRKRDREFVVDEPETFAVAAERAHAPASGEMMDHVARCVARLPLELRRIHELRYLEGRAQRVACETLGMSRQELRTKELRLLDALRRLLTETFHSLARARDGSGFSARRKPARRAPRSARAPRDHGCRTHP